jgi:hypothetical protein
MRGPVETYVATAREPPQNAAMLYLKNRPHRNNPQKRRSAQSRWNTRAHWIGMAGCARRARIAMQSV